MASSSPAPEDDGGAPASEASFQSADEEDDFDLPQDLGTATGAASSAGPAPESGGGDGDAAEEEDDDALPPGLEEEDGADQRWNLKRDGNREQLEPIHQRLSIEREHVKISKMFSYVLRHAAHKLDVRIRKDGFVRLREIMKLRNFKPYNLEEIMAAVYFDEKERYTMVREFDGELLIRANQGHTMKVVESELLLEQITDPSTVTECVHGTYLVHWPFVKRQGLSKVARNHIHMANGLPEDGKIRGMRSTAELFVYVDVPKAMEDGVIFFRSKNDVILTVGIDGWLPTKYFVKAVRIDYNTCDIEELEFEPDSEVPNWAAELAPSGPGEQGTYQIKNLDSLIGNSKRRLQEINGLKALQEQGEELDEEELAKIAQHAQVYSELQSLEQRMRQHKSHRREGAAEKELRMKEEAEAASVVRRKDRAVTPPWEKGRQTLESVGTKTSAKEQAEWAMIGKRRSDADGQTPTAGKRASQSQKDDPWDKIGSMRAGATPTAATPGGGESRRSGAPTLRSQRSGGAERFGGGDEKGKGGSSWRFGGGGGESGKRASTEEKRDGPPRFFNSKASGEGGATPGGSWRDRMTAKPSGGGDGDGDERPLLRKQLSAREDDEPPGPSWRRPKPIDSSPEPDGASSRQMPSGRHANTQQDQTPSWRTPKQGAEGETPSWRSRMSGDVQPRDAAEEPRAPGGAQPRSGGEPSRQGAAASAAGDGGPPPPPAHHAPALAAAGGVQMLAAPAAPPSPGAAAAPQQQMQQQMQHQMEQQQQMQQQVPMAQAMWQGQPYGAGQQMYYVPPGQDAYGQQGGMAGGWMGQTQPHYMADGCGQGAHMNQQQMGYGVYGSNQNAYGGYPQEQQQSMNSGMQQAGGNPYSSPSGADGYQHQGGQVYGYQGDYGAGYASQEMGAGFHQYGQGGCQFYGNESGGGHYGMDSDAKGGPRWKGEGGPDPAASKDGKGKGGSCGKGKKGEKGEKGKGGKAGRGKERGDEAANDWEALGRMRAAA